MSVNRETSQLDDECLPRIPVTAIPAYSDDERLVAGHDGILATYAATAAKTALSRPSANWLILITATALTTVATLSAAGFVSLIAYSENGLVTSTAAAAAAGTVHQQGLEAESATSTAATSRCTSDHRKCA